MKILKTSLAIAIAYWLVFIVCSSFEKKHFFYISKNTKNDYAHPLPCFLVISDIHLYSSLKQSDTLPNSKTTVNNNGDTGNDLWDSTKKEIRKLIAENKPKFIIILGDLQRHNVVNKDDRDSNFEKVFDFFRDTISIPASIPVIYTAGNNDSWNGDYGSFYIPDFFYTKYGYPYANVYLHASATHACIANDSLQKELDCFSAYPLGKENKLKLIVLNTIMFTSTDTYSSDPKQQNIDANKQLSWLREELTHTPKDENILIAMHIPPGVDGYLKTRLAGKYLWSQALQFEGRSIQNAFLDITDSCKNIIGMLASHSHMDGIRLLQKDSNSIASLLISAPSIAPGHRNNPAIKLVTYAPNHQFALNDFTTYYMKYWGDKKSISLRSWDSSFSFKTAFPYYRDSSMLGSLKQVFTKNNKASIDSLVESIYTVHNGRPIFTMNDAKRTIYVRKQ